MGRADEIYLGSDVKLNVHVERMGDVPMSKYHFTVDVFAGKSNTITIDKSEAKQIDDDNYMVCFNSSALGLGRIIAIVKCEIPDEEIKGHKRTEIVRVDTGLNIIYTK